MTKHDKPKTVPATVDVGPHTYTVATDRAAVHRASFDMDGTVSGWSNHERLEIVVDGELSESVVADTLWHEVLHAIFEHYGIDYELGDAVSEKVIRRLSPATVDVLRRNPKLAALILDR